MIFLMSAAAIASRISYSPAPISLQQKAGQALHVFGYTLARPFQWITEPLIRCVITPLSPEEYGNCHIKAVEVVRRALTVPACVLAGIPLAVLSLCGAGIESIGDCLNGRPYTYYKGEAEEISVLNRGPTLMTWNACMFYGGLPMAFGGVSPAFDRIGEVATVIKDYKPEILALQEMSYGPSLALYKKLRKQYSHFFLRIGPNPLRMESCLFVASKHALVSEPKFFSFPDQFGIKRGYFCLETAQFWVATTHLEPKDKKKRVAQFMAVTEKLQQLAQNKLCFLLGDLNLIRTGDGDDEYTQLKVYKLYKDPHRYDILGTCTEAFNAYMRGKKRPEKIWENIDYTLLMQSPSSPISFDLHLQVLRSGVNPNNPAQALSDHRALKLICDITGTEKKRGRERAKRGKTLHRKVLRRGDCQIVLHSARVQLHRSLLAKSSRAPASLFRDSLACMRRLSLLASWISNLAGSIYPPIQRLDLQTL